MWTIFNKLFGWHYVEYRDSVATFVARVYMTPSGSVRMKGGFCRGHYDANLISGGEFCGRGGRWTALTWDGAL